MPDFSELLQQGGASAWLFFPSAILLGALHGLEPGHSKTMMAAFIVAVRGTVTQAVLLGLAATASHTLVVWAVALGGLYFGGQIDAETSEPYFQLASGAIVVALALWMLWRTWNGLHPPAHGHNHNHLSGNSHSHHAHEAAHASDIERRFAGREVTSWQIVLFGLTGGLIPCPAAITVLLLCLQVKEFTLGVVLVLCFSVGLAAVLVAVGAGAALSVRHAGRRWPWLSSFAQRAPYLSSLLIVGVGVYLGVHGWLGLA